MEQGRLNPWTGEFASPAEELAYRAYSAPELLRRSRILCLLSAFVNIGLILNDVTILDPHALHLALGGRTLAIAAALVCFFALRHAKDFAETQRTISAGLWATAVATAILITTGNQMGLVAMLVIPTVYYLVVPISFRAIVLAGAGCTAMTVGGYLLFPPKPHLVFGITFAAVTLNIFLITVIGQHNRHGRLEWAAMQSEREARRVQMQSQQLLERTFATVPIPSSSQRWRPAPSCAATRPACAISVASPRPSASPA